MIIKHKYKKKKKNKFQWNVENINYLIIIKYLQTNQISALNNP